MFRLADYIFKYLAKYGVKHIFLVTGGGAMHLGYFRRWIRTVLAGYLVVGAFATGYMVTSAIKPTDTMFSIVVASLIAGPLA